MKPNFIVMAHRSGLSIFGAADAPCKKDGKILYFETREEAEAYQEQVSIGKSLNVHYTVQPNYYEHS